MIQCDTIALAIFLAIVLIKTSIPNSPEGTGWRATTPSCYRSRLTVQAWGRHLPPGSRLDSEIFRTLLHQLFDEKNQ